MSSKLEFVAAAFLPVLLVVAACAGEVTGKGTATGTGGTRGAGFIASAGGHATGASTTAETANAGAGGSLETQASVAVAIEPGSTSYGAWMSSVPGMPLTPVVSGSVPDSPLYRWRSDYGAFVLWQPPDYQVVDQGSDFVVGDTTVYWSYLGLPADTDIPVQIRLDLLDGSGLQVLATTELKLVWTVDGGVAVE